MSRDKIVTGTLRDLLQALGVDGDYTALLKRERRQQEAALALYKRKLAEESGRVIDELFTALKEVQCDHPEHRIWPINDSDTVAMHNMSALLAAKFSDVSRSVARSAFDMGFNVGAGTLDGGSYDVREDALYGVVGAALLEFQELMSQTNNRVDEVFDKFELNTRKRMSNSVELLLTGKAASQEPSSSKHCH